MRPQSIYGQELARTARTWATTWLDVVRGRSSFSDVIAGITVAAVALPLNLALAVACGLPPQAGLIAGAIGGMVAATLGGSVLQVTGPAAALSPLVLAITVEFGAEGAAFAALVVGLISLGLGFGGLGRAIKYVPEAVLAGFTTGVGLKLLDNQIPEFLGFDYRVIDLVQMMHRPAWLHHVEWLAVISGVIVILLVVTLREFKRFPAALVGITLVTGIAIYLKWDVTRVGEIPSQMPAPHLPDLPEEKWIDLILACLPLGLLAAVESLLAARAIDRMSGTDKPHHTNLELVGQGAANLAVGLFAGMPVTGVIVRGGVNVQSGGKTRLSSLVHGAVLLIAMLYFTPELAQIPLAALAGLLIVVGTRLIEVHTLRALWQSNRGEAVAFVLAAAGTVSGHLMAGLLAAIAVHYAVHRLAPQLPEAIEPADRSVRAEVEREPTLHHGMHHHHRHAPVPSIHEAATWLRHIRERPQIARSAYVHPQATVIGRVMVREHVHIAAGSSVRADEGSPFYIGADTNLQDGVIMHALKERVVRVDGERYAIYLGRRVSLAHAALVHGPTYIGDDTFVGFKAIVHDAVVGRGCFIGHGALVVGVEIADGRFVRNGAVIDHQTSADALPKVSDMHGHFNADVVEVNRGLTTAYHHDTFVDGLRTLSRTRERKSAWSESLSTLTGPKARF